MGMVSIKRTSIPLVMAKGIISAVSNHFCQTCNRVRLTAKGDLILCLGQEDAISLKDAVRSVRYSANNTHGRIGAFNFKIMGRAICFASINRV
jgi:molybdenum cofactor biosynthesis enzyme MoaA